MLSYSINTRATKTKQNLFTMVSLFKEARHYVSRMKYLESYNNEVTGHCHNLNVARNLA